MKKAITLAMIVCVALTALSGLAYAGKAKHWICATCGKRVSKESMPSLSGCTKNRTHSWVIDY